MLATTSAARIIGIERSPEFAEAARERVARGGRRGAGSRSSRPTPHAYPLEPEAWDARSASARPSSSDDLAGTLAALAPTVRAGGHVVVGEPYWRSGRCRARSIDDQGFVTLPRDRRSGSRRPASRSSALIASSEDDWDRYESLHWRALEEWLAENPGDPDATEIRERHERARDAYLRRERACSAGRSSSAAKPSRPKQLRASTGVVAREQRAEALGLEQVPAAEPGLVDLELGEDRDRVGVARRGRLAVLGDEPVAQRVEARVGGEDRAARRAAATTVPFQRFSSSRNATSQRPVACDSESSRAPAPNAIALPASLPSRRTRKRRCLPSPTVASSPSSQPGASSVTSGLPSPNGASRASSAQRSSVSRVPRGTIASTCVTGAQVVLDEQPGRVRGERRRERGRRSRA